MAMAKALCYQRLEQEFSSDEDDIRKHVIGGLRNSRFRGVQIRRKLRLKVPKLKIGGMTRKPSLIKIAWSKLCTRLKECHSQFGELFAGNYLFLQVNPTLFNPKAATVADDNGKPYTSIKDNGFPRLSASPRHTF